MDKELIEHIKTQLQNHEESYSAGAWERFNEEDSKKRGFVFWPLWAAAALILVFGATFLLFNKSDRTNQIANSKPKPTVNKLPGSTIPSSKNTPVVVPNQSATTNYAEQEKRTGAQSTSHLPQETSQKSNSFLSASHSDQLLSNSIYSPSISSDFDKIEITKNTKTEKTLSKRTFEDLLAEDSRKNAYNKVVSTQNSSKWEQDVYVAPAMGNDNKVNMNYGFSLSYAIDKKLSISSGVSYAALSSTESLDASAPQTLSGRNLEAISAKVRGINIPLELKYKISDNLYTGIGVSALAVINNAQQNTYIVNEVQSMATVTSNGAMEQKNFIVQQKTNEPQQETAIDPNKYIGFYNFSLGYKQKISKKNNVAIEPFLRVPMKTFSKENLNLTNGGLRLKIDF